MINAIKKLGKDRKKTLLMILLLSFGVRLTFISMLKPNGFYFSDTRHYDSAALSLLSGEGYGEKYNRSPVYPVFMALIYAVFGHSFVAVRFVETLLGVLLVWLIYHIARKAFDDRVALVSAVLAALFPHFIILTGLLYSTNLFTLFLACSIYFLVKSEEKEAVHYIVLSGVCAGLATLTIPAMFFILPFWLLWLMMRTQRSAGFNFVKTLIFSAIILAVLTPWTIRNFQKYDRLTLVRPVPHTAFPTLDDLNSQRAKIANGFEDTTEYLKKHPNGTDDDKLGRIFGNYLKHPVQSITYMLGEIGHFWALYPDRLDTPSPEYQQKILAQDHRMVRVKKMLWNAAVIASIIIMSPVFAFSLVGLFTSRPVNRKKMLLLICIIGMMIGYSLIYAEVRYRIPIEPYVLMFMAAGLVRMYALLQVRRETKSIPSPTGAMQANWASHITTTEKVN
ncbi:glycosyltransferase family 39 protein [candidate division KSB1 bacterium]|nr:glycosyltransferase family 39 protein [candidate division KSB1 bacterium]